MFEYGHNQYNSYNRENVCDIVSSFAEEIVDIANKYMESLGE
jgi:hypothetical protein